MNVNIPPHPPTPRVHSINCFCKFTWTLTSRSINCCRKFTWTLTSHPTPPTPRVHSINCFCKFTWTLTSRSINCCRKFTWTLTSHPYPPTPSYVVPKAGTSLYIHLIYTITMPWDNGGLVGFGGSNGILSGYKGGNQSYWSLSQIQIKCKKNLKCCFCFFCLIGIHKRIDVKELLQNSDVSFLPPKLGGSSRFPNSGDKST